jgi:hypothetical protein
MVMRNGDRMTCAIKGLNSGVLYVDFDYIDGTASVDWTKVARLESSQLFLVKTEDGSVYEGTLSTPETGAERPLQIQVLEKPEQQVVIDRRQVVRMIATSDRFWQRFNGGLSFGVIYSKGNQSTQYNLGSETSYVRERWTAWANFASSLSSSAGGTTSTRNSLSLGALRLLPRNHWFYSGLGGFLQSSEQGITLQSTLGGGVGRYLKNTDRASVALLGGMAWQSTQYNQSLATSGQNVASVLIYLDAKLFKFSKTNLDVTASLLPALSDPGRVRFNTNAAYYIKLIGNLKWNVSFYGNWDNRPPPGVPSGSDYGTSSGVSWTFGLK